MSSTLKGKTILLIGYGGGHMRMLIPVAHALQRRGAEVCLLPLTVGIVDATASGLPLRTLGQIYEGHPDEARLLSLGQSIAPASAHTAISDRETYIYHGIGLADLIDEIGEAGARQRFTDAGRAAFHPVASWTELLKRLAPDMVISTSVKRHESAALIAAGRLGIASLCLVDHFALFDFEHLSRPGHGDKITVLGSAIADLLTDLGRPAEEICVTGNPGFDAMVEPEFARAGAALRRELGWQDRQIILWPMEGGVLRQGGEDQVPTKAIAASLWPIIDGNSGLGIMLRPHPNNPGFIWEGDEQSAYFAGHQPIEVLLHACDIVVSQTTTVGLQAALLGKPVITIANRGVPPFAEYGLAVDIPDLASLPVALAHLQEPDPARLGAPPVGSAAARIADVAKGLLR